MPPVGFEPTISAGERPQIYALDRSSTVIGIFYRTFPQNCTLEQAMKAQAVSSSTPTLFL
jgi:hypothetical protein